MEVNENIENKDNQNKENQNKENQESNFYDCKICLIQSVEPIVTKCGHLFCWECIYQWAESKQSEKVSCPVCIGEVDIKSVIPLYTSQENHRKKTEGIPNRPMPNRQPFNNANDNHANFQFFINGFWFNIGAGNFEGNNNLNLRRALSLIPVFIFLFAPSFMEFFYKLLFIGFQEKIVLWIK